MNGRFVRLAEAERPSVRLLVDGEPIEALQGDTLMVALLTRVSALRQSFERLHEQIDYRPDTLVWSLTPGQLCCVSQGKHTSVEPCHIRRFATSSLQRSRAL